jgi:hypothetical protein
MKAARGIRFERWAMAGVLATAITWGAQARADEAYVAPNANGSKIAPIVPANGADLGLKVEPADHTPPDGGRIGTGERLRDHGSSLRKDLIRKRTVIDRSRGGGTGPGPGDPDQLQITPPVETQPISVGYLPAGNGPAPVPEPSGFALMGIGLASWLVCNMRRRM